VTRRNSERRKQNRPCCKFFQYPWKHPCICMEL